MLIMLTKPHLDRTAEREEILTKNEPAVLLNLASGPVK